MKTISQALLAHLGGAEITIAMLWKVSRPDGTIFGFTDHDQDISFTDNESLTPVVYKSHFGADASATTTHSDMSISNQELVAFIESDEITEADIFAGKYDYATIEIRIVNWNNLNMGALLWKKATLGEVKIQNGKFIAELRGLEFYLNTNMGETYGPICRADLGDSRCTVNLALWRQNSTVATVTNLRSFTPGTTLLQMQGSTPNSPAPGGWFNDGVITWLSGKNAGYTMEAAIWDGTTITLFEDMPNPIQPGDQFSIDPGCDKSNGLDGCQKFNNIVNFRGEPFIPGMDAMMMYPNASGAVPAG